MDLRLVASKIPKDLARSLLFEAQKNLIIIRAKRRIILEPKDLTRLSNLGGKLVLTEKDSHFEILETEILGRLRKTLR